LNGKPEQSRCEFRFAPAKHCTQAAHDARNATLYCALQQGRKSGRNSVPEDLIEFCAQRAEFELAAAATATDERRRRKHYFEAARYLNLVHGGDPRPQGSAPVRY
jgi:hypothetical protein